MGNAYAHNSAEIARQEGVEWQQVSNSTLGLWRNGNGFRCVQFRLQANPHNLIYPKTPDSLVESGVSVEGSVTAIALPSTPRQIDNGRRYASAYPIDTVVYSQIAPRAFAIARHSKR